MVPSAISVTTILKISRSDRLLDALRRFKIHMCSFTMTICDLFHLDCAIDLVSRTQDSEKKSDQKDRIRS